MKTPFCVRGTLAVLCSALAGASLAEPETADAPLRLTVHLTDGSRLVGVSPVESVQVRTSFADLTVPLNHIAGIRIGDDHETVSFDMRNGDRLTGGLTLEEIELETVFGKVGLAVKHIRSVSVHAGGRDLPASLLEGRILHFSFDADEGRTVANQAGQRHAGTVHGATWTAQGKTGGAYVFDGIRDSIVVKADAELDVSEAMTILAWVKPTDLRRPYNTILTRNFGGGEQYGLRFTGASLYVSFSDTRRGFDATVAGPFPANQWHHFALVFCGKTRQGKIFGNGRPLAVQALTERMRPRISGDLFIGRDNRNTDHNFQGKMDEVILFRRALTEEEIGRIYEAQR